MFFARRDAWQGSIIDCKLTKGRATARTAACSCKNSHFFLGIRRRGQSVDANLAQTWSAKGFWNSQASQDVGGGSQGDLGRSKSALGKTKGRKEVSFLGLRPSFRL
jgi:hypothetical protein